MDMLINEMLQEYKCPIVNSIFFSNGDLLVLEQMKMGKKNKIRTICKSTVHSYFEFNSKSYVCHFSVLSIFTDGKFCAHVGEGSMGGDGIIYLTDSNKEHLVWFIFFNDSNPFEKVMILDDNVIAYSTLGKKWIIPILEPTKIDILDI